MTPIAGFLRRQNPREGALKPFGFVAIGLAFSAGVAAKDLPPRKAEPAKRATGCEGLGAGYQKMPGSNTCIKVSGSVRVESSVTIQR